MAVRIECENKSFKDKKIWIDFQDERWPFGDKRKVIGSFDDAAALVIILGYIENWNMIDVDGDKVPFDVEKGIELFDNLDSREIIPWIVGAWFEARNKRTEVSPNS